jgi:hypothetical protein
MGDLPCWVHLGSVSRGTHLLACQWYSMPIQTWDRLAHSLQHVNRRASCQWLSISSTALRIWETCHIQNTFRTIFVESGAPTALRGCLPSWRSSLVTCSCCSRPVGPVDPVDPVGVPVRCRTTRRTEWQPDRPYPMATDAVRAWCSRRKGVLWHAYRIPNQDREPSRNMVTMNSSGWHSY